MHICHCMTTLSFVNNNYSNENIIHNYLKKSFTLSLNCKYKHLFEKNGSNLRFLTGRT